MVVSLSGVLALVVEVVEESGWSGEVSTNLSKSCVSLSSSKFEARRRSKKPDEVLD